MAGRVAGKVALITGGASGIGRGCAARLAEEGATVIISDVQDEFGRQAAEEISAAAAAAGGACTYLHHDVTSEDAWIDVIRSIEQRYGSLHVLVNNAGIGIGGSIVEMKLADWQRQQAINLDGVFLGIKHAIPLLRTTGGGSIVNMSSVAGLKGSPRLAAYNATKGGVRLLTKGVALECAQARWNIRVNSVHPGIIDTPIWTKVAPGELEPGANALDVAAMAAAAVPTGVAGLPLDIANAVLFLASDDSSYVTGTELVVDGGLSA
ncbi:MAG: glucose 1-dehydrogenase [Gammaproteobacteria bacterium]|nr:MAG: glucose 1-dehydrogenase [Gammaproteobacteria bacterium]